MTENSNFKRLEDKIGISFKHFERIEGAFDPIGDAEEAFNIGSKDRRIGEKNK